VACNCCGGVRKSGAPNKLFVACGIKMQYMGCGAGLQPPLVLCLQAFSMHHSPHCCSYLVTWLTLLLPMQPLSALLEAY
jgi:hypothetical protein